MEGEESGKVLHIVMFPWLAIGHLRPFFRLSKSLARRGHRISFISTPKNLERVAHVPQNLSHLIHLVTLPLPLVEHLPPKAESSMDVPHEKQQLLKVAVDLLEPSVSSFLENVRPKPDWIVYDYSFHWVPQLASGLGISSAFFSLFTAAMLAYFGPPSVWLSERYAKSTAQDFTVVPEWIPFPSNMAFHLHEMVKNMEKVGLGNQYNSGTSDFVRFGLTIDGSDIVIFRSCTEFEPEWFDLIHQLYQKPIIPVGALPLSQEDEDDQLVINEEWLEIKSFLDAQKENSLVYVALGMEAVLTKEEAQALALGLEQCGFPFFWVLNREHLLEMLPDGFLDRVKGRGIVYPKWAPQIRILSHPAVGAFLTHCGWNSVTEALSFGRILILFPVMNDQGLNARLLQDKKVGIEIPRNPTDGFFTGEVVAEAVRCALVGDEGKEERANATRMKGLFGNNGRNENYIDHLLLTMIEARARTK